MEKITVEFEVNRGDINERLGNVGSVPIEEAMTELLDSLLDQPWVSCGNCGRGYLDEDTPAIRGTFTIKETH